MNETKTRTLPRSLKILLLTLLILAVLGGGIYGVLLLMRGSGKEVNVYSASDICVYASAGDAQSEGSVTTDRIQSVYITATQQITEINVREGQRVHAGDLILSFDTTLTDLELERQEILVRKLELDLENAKKHQAEVNTYRLYVPPAPQEEPELSPAASMPMLRKGTGSPDDPYVFLWNDLCTYTPAFVSSILPLVPEGGEDMPTAYAVFEVRAADSPQGGILRCWEMVFGRAPDGSWSFSIVEPKYDPRDPGEEEEEEEETPIDTTPSYSWNDLVRMKRDAAQAIIDLELELKMAKLKYETLQYELTSGAVYSKIDGVVKSVLDPEEALASKKPVVLISGGGGYYVTGALSETELDAMHVGDTVNVRSWEAYETLTGTITEISDYPDESNRYWHYSSGNQNVSLYPFTVFLTEDAALREGEWVQLTYSPTVSQGSGIYLMNPFIRTENGKSYVWCEGEDGTLEKRSVITGGTLWGSYQEILYGITMDDHLAFPYGRDLQEGAPAREVGINELYGYY